MIFNARRVSIGSVVTVSCPDAVEAAFERCGGRIRPCQSPYRPLESLTAEDFRPHVGGGFRLADEPVEWELIEVTAQKGSAQPGSRASFSVVFRGPRQPVLDQRIRRLEHDTMGVLELFLVPVGPDDAGMLYEAGVYVGAGVHLISRCTGPASSAVTNPSLA